MGIVAGIDKTTTLPAEARSAGLARRFVSSALHEAGYELFDEVAVLLTSELVTNAVLHARTDVHLHLLLHDDRVRVEVHDGGRGPATPRHFAADATTGRGLMLVAELAADWGSDARPQGKCVWFELDAGGSGGWDLGASA